MLLRYIKWFFAMYIRLIKVIVTWPIAKLIGSAQPARESVSCGSESMDDIAKRDLVNSLDNQIAALENEKRYYMRECEMSKTGEDKKIKLQSKIAQIDVRIMKLSRQVLKLREEIENE